MHISISPGNEKMGTIRSISLPSGVTCRVCDCNQKCYARKIERRRPNVRAAYQRNLNILQTKPDIFWREVEAAVMLSRFFRFHVSGDIPDITYLQKMIELASRNEHCEILCFTKKYEIVNSYVWELYKKRVYDAPVCPVFDVFNNMIPGKVLPKNLHIVFSVWTDLEVDNPFSFPEAHVKYRNGTTTANQNAVECSGNCTNCAIIDGGCWSLKSGEQVVFDEH